MAREKLITTSRSKRWKRYSGSKLMTASSKDGSSMQWTIQTCEVLYNAAIGAHFVFGREVPAIVDAFAMVEALVLVAYEREKRDHARDVLQSYQNVLQLPPFGIITYKNIKWKYHVLHAKNYTTLDATKQKPKSRWKPKYGKISKLQTMRPRVKPKREGEGVLEKLEQFFVLYIPWREVAIFVACRESLS